MAVKNKVEVRICGKDYTLVGVESDEYIQKVGLYIDKKMNEIVRSDSKLSTSMAAVLTALNVTDDYFKSCENEARLRDELKRLEDSVERLSAENVRLADENSALSNKNTYLQLELAKREAELSEVRNSIDKAVRVKE